MEVDGITFLFVLVIEKCSCAVIVSLDNKTIDEEELASSISLKKPTTLSTQKNRAK